MKAGGLRRRQDFLEAPAEDASLEEEEDSLAGVGLLSFFAAPSLSDLVVSGLDLRA